MEVYNQNMKREAAMPRWKVQETVDSIMERLSSGEIEQSARMLQELVAITPRESWASGLIERARQSIILMHKVFDTHEISIEDALSRPQDLSDPVLNYSLLLDARGKLETLEKLKDQELLYCAKLHKGVTLDAIDKLTGRISNNLLYELQDRAMDDRDADLDKVSSRRISNEIPAIDMITEGIVKLHLGDWSEAMSIFENCIENLSALEELYDGFHLTHANRKRAERLLGAAKYLYERSLDQNEKDFSPQDIIAGGDWKCISRALGNSATVKGIRENLSMAMNMTSKGHFLEAASLMEMAKRRIKEIRGVYSKHARKCMQQELSSAASSFKETLMEFRSSILLGIIESIESLGAGEEARELSRISECRALLALLGTTDEDVMTVKNALDDRVYSLSLAS